MALPTALDNLNATMYALDRLRRERCVAPGLAYRPDDRRRMYPCPRALPDCAHGRCVVADEAACRRRSPDLEFRDGRCVYADTALRQWCTQPALRRPDAVPGVTDVHPFDYDPATGKCSISRAYCEDDMQTAFDPDRRTCVASAGQRVGEFLVGKTVFRGIQRGLARGLVAAAERGSRPLVEGGSRPLVEHFAGPGIHLYAGPDGALRLDEQAVRRTYPDRPYTAADLAADNNLRRIFLVRSLAA